MGKNSAAGQAITNDKAFSGTPAVSRLRTSSPRSSANSSSQRMLPLPFNTGGIGVGHRGAVHAQHGREFPACRNAVARTQITGMHQGAQLVAELNIERDVALRLEMKWQHCLSPSVNFSKNWPATRANLSFDISPCHLQAAMGFRLANGHFAPPHSWRFGRPPKGAKRRPPLTGYPGYPLPGWRVPRPR